MVGGETPPGLTMDFLLLPVLLLHPPGGGDAISEWVLFSVPNFQWVFLFDFWLTTADKLTRFLQYALSGNGKTTIIVTVCQPDILISFRCSCILGRSWREPARIQPARSFFPEPPDLLPRILISPQHSWVCCFDGCQKVLKKFKCPRCAKWVENGLPTSKLG